MRCSVAGTEIDIQGRLIRKAALPANWNEEIGDPRALISAIKDISHRVDIFSFFQRPPNVLPQFEYYWEEFPVAVIELKDYKHWWEKDLSKNSRQNVNKALNRGVEARSVEFTEEFVLGICEIYNETPIRQGKKFPHYGKSFDEMYAAHATFLERSEFIGAYHGDELIGFIKLVFENGFTDILQILSKLAHRDKAPTNLLVAKAVEICAQRGERYLAYGDFDSGGLGDFKRRNGFKRMDLPRYYVPLTILGRLTLLTRLHRPARQILPQRLHAWLRSLRAKWTELAVRLGRGGGRNPD